MEESRSLSAWFEASSHALGGRINALSSCCRIWPCNVDVTDRQLLFLHTNKNIYLQIMITELKDCDIQDYRNGKMLLCWFGLE